VQEQVFQQWNINGTGPLATNGIEAGVKIRPTEEELKMMDSWPCKEFRSGWDSYFKDKPDKPVMHYSVIAGWFGDHVRRVSFPHVQTMLITYPKTDDHAARQIFHNVRYYFPRSQDLTNMPLGSTFWNILSRVAART
jgi:hypothetical protein